MLRGTFVALSAAGSVALALATPASAQTKPAMRR